jgi:dihydroneopterin aldolase
VRRRSTFDTAAGAFYVPAVRTLYQIALRGMRFHARVGVLPHERELPQPIELDLIVWPRAPHDLPDVGKLLDYRALYHLAAGALSEGPVDYLEGLAAVVADRVMAAGNVNRVRVQARKPHVALPGPVSHAEVSIELTRDEM